MCRAAPSWEVTLLRRPPGARRPRVAGRVVFEAPDLAQARTAAQEALEERSGGEPLWSLGVIRPLTPEAPGTRRYKVTFAIWESDDERFLRRDVHEILVWAADAADARRLAQAEIQCVAGYLPAWRIRQVVRIAVTA
jgi:hypothetical protein